MRSTKQTDRSRAQEIALAFERCERMAGQDMLTEVQCRKVVADILSRTNTGQVFRLTSIQNWFESWLQNKTNRIAAGTAHLYRHAVDSFIESLGERAGRPLETLTPGDIDSWVSGRMGEIAPGTVSLYGGIIRSSLRAAQKQGLILSNPSEAIELPEKRGITRGVFTPTEMKLLVDTAEGEWKTLILVGYYTGARLSDCALLRWAELSMADSTLTHRQRKTDKVVVIPIHAELRAHLEQIAVSDRAQEYVMPGLAEEAASGRKGLSDTFKKIAVAAGIDIQPVKGAGGRMQNLRTFHALRHSFTSALANAGVSPELRMKLTGHSSSDVHRGYTHLELEALRQAVEKLPKL
jgi:integrase